MEIIILLSFALIGYSACCIFTKLIFLKEFLSLKKENQTLKETLEVTTKNILDSQKDISDLKEQLNQFEIWKSIVPIQNDKQTTLAVTGTAVDSIKELNDKYNTLEAFVIETQLDLWEVIGILREIRNIDHLRLMQVKKTYWHRDHLLTNETIRKLYKTLEDFK